MFREQTQFNTAKRRLSMKRIILAILTVVVILTFAVAGCSVYNDDETQITTAKATAETPVTNGTTASETKTITVKVVHSDKTEKILTIVTDASFLRAALDSKDLIKGDEGEFGLFINEVDGECADYSKNESWWCLTKGGEMLMTGVETTPISNGDTFELTYTIGY